MAKNTSRSAAADTKKNARSGKAPIRKVPEETGFITELDRYLFGAGTHYEIFEKLGAHPRTWKGTEGYYFAVWAPHARAVHLTGDFNGWNTETHPMTPLATSGIWELFVPGMKEGQLYKFAVTAPSGQVLFKADPFAFLFHQRAYRGKNQV